MSTVVVVNIAPRYVSKLNNATIGETVKRAVNGCAGFIQSLGYRSRVTVGVVSHDVYYPHIV